MSKPITMSKNIICKILGHKPNVFKESYITHVYEGEDYCTHTCQRCGVIIKTEFIEREEGANEYF